VEALHMAAQAGVRRRQHDVADLGVNLLLSLVLTLERAAFWHPVGSRRVPTARRGRGQAWRYTTTIMMAREMRKVVTPRRDCPARLAGGGIAPPRQHHRQPPVCLAVQLLHPAWLRAAKARRNAS
jgi:hypothetical protein